MSEESRRMITAYEKMLEDGTAYKKVDMTQRMEPDLAEATGKRGKTNPISNNPLGEELEDRNENYNMEEDYTDYSEFDSIMQQRVNSLKQKRKGTNENKPIRLKGSKKEIEALKKRVRRLEEAMITIMETHEQIMEEL